MKFYMESIKVWYPQCETPLSLKQSLCENHQKVVWPILDFVPAMQRRRLSPFAKIALFTAENALHAAGYTTPEDQQIPIVFSSRHGDLHKTSDLLKDLANEDTLSPTAFSLSVHNAAPGLYSILKQNKQAINVVSAGQDSFFMALIDVYARLKSRRCEKVLFIHTDQALPHVYHCYQDEVQLDHSIAIVLSLSSFKKGTCFELSFSANDSDSLALNKLKLPPSLAFIQWLEQAEPMLKIMTDRNIWQCAKNV